MVSLNDVNENYIVVRLFDYFNFIESIYHTIISTGISYMVIVDYDIVVFDFMVAYFRSLIKVTT